ncbi:response regulator [Novispirillum sp. DQ9]|uniref:response regulator n=1 Tax=Novispirillum sp. DQ9 TaxID=3398612 RepID=UPI003C7CE36E
MSVVETRNEPSEAPVCRSVADLRTGEARRLMADLLGAFLDDNAATPLELLHSPRLQKAIETSPVRRAAVQKAAEAQATAAGVSVAQRAADLEALCKAVVTDTRKRLKEGGADAIVPGAYAKGVSAARAGLTGGDADFAVHAGIAAGLATCKDRPAKIERLLGYCEEAADELQRGYADAHLGEHLAASGMFRDLWGNPEGLAELLGDMIDLLVGDPPKDKPTPALVRRLQALCAANPMSATRDGLVDALVGELNGSDRLVPSVKDDLMGQKALLLELLAAADIARRLKRSDGFIGGKRTHDALDRRVSMAVSGEKLHELMRGKSFMDKLRDLFRLQAAVAATSSTKAIDDYILFLLEGRDFLGRVLDCSDTPEGRLCLLGELQSLVLASTLARAKRRDLALTLDKGQHDFLKTTSILAPLRKPKPTVAAVLHVADLLAQGAFTAGACAGEARELVLRHIRHRDFVRKYVEGQDLPAADGDDKPTVAERITALSERLQKAGIPFLDLSRLRVLVAEDEESARSYIEMVLADMGITNVMAVGDGRQALKVFQDFEDGVDLIICDWMMPRMSGLDFLKQVRSVRPHLPFLMVTALATMENVEQALAHDVTGYIAKPFPPEQLEEKILLLVGRGIEGDHEAEGKGTA